MTLTKFDMKETEQKFWDYAYPMISKLENFEMYLLTLGVMCGSYAVLRAEIDVLTMRGDDDREDFETGVIESLAAWKQICEEMFPDGPSPEKLLFLEKN